VLTLTQNYLYLLYITYNGVGMKTIKKPVKYKSLSIPEPLFKEMHNLVQKSPSYRTMAEFLREAIREKMENDKLKNQREILIKKIKDKRLFMDFEWVRSPKNPFGFEAKPKDHTVELEADVTMLKEEMKEFKNKLKELSKDNKSKRNKSNK
jgi:Arc/MetJ-type ribon-helix-helix transcriptional regulator